MLLFSLGEAWTSSAFLCEDSAAPLRIFGLFVASRSPQNNTVSVQRSGEEAWQWGWVDLKREVMTSLHCSVLGQSALKHYSVTPLDLELLRSDTKSVKLRLKKDIFFEGEGSVYHTLQ